MLRRIAISSFFLFIFGSLAAQHAHSNWYFGKYAGLKFQGSTPSPIVVGSLFTIEGCASISDSSGHLLFYTDGVSVWNQNHALMANGTDLFGDISSTQSAAIVPYPGHPHLFFIVTTSEQNDSEGLRYSLVDMNQANGLGAVTLKNLPLSSHVSERLAIIAHANQRDYWILTHRKNTRQFLAFLVDPQGIQRIYLSSLVGKVDSTSVGYLKASPDGKKLAMAFRDDNMYEIYDFDPRTGQVTNPISLPPIYNQSYGCAFSPNSEKLYIHSSRSDAPIQPSQLFQVDVSRVSASDVISSVRQIANIGVAHPGCMQLGPDGRIYIARHNSFYLGVIEFPNELGQNCTYQDEGLYLGGRRSQFGLNNVCDQQILPPPKLHIERYCAQDSVFFFAQEAIAIDSFQWSTSDPNTTISSNQAQAFHVFKQSGTYTVQMIYFRGKQCDSLQQTIQIMPKPWVSLGEDTSVCPHEIIELNPLNPSLNILPTQFQWQDGSSNPTNLATETQLYWIEVANECGIARDSMHIRYRELPQVELGNDTLLCEGTSITLNPRANEWGQFRWEDGSTSRTRRIEQAGLYWVELEDACGSSRDSIKVKFETPPNISLGVDTLICLGEEIFVDATPQPLSRINYHYLWEDGSQMPRRILSQAGTYHVQVKSNVCAVQDSINLSTRAAPYVDFGEDTSICNESPLMLSAYGDAATFLWQDGSRRSYFTVQQSGTYWVEATNNCGSAYDDVKVIVNRMPQVELGNDTIICFYHEMTLDASDAAGEVQYNWENGSTLPYRKITNSGIYQVSLTNVCGTQIDSIEIKKSIQACDCKLFIPNVITPNHDGVNDQFVISYPCDFTHFDLKIFDRWGKRVYATQDPSAHWDGCQDAKSCPEGTYFYVFSYQGKDTFLSKEERKLSTQKGSLVLLR